MDGQELTVIAWMKARRGLENEVRHTLAALIEPTRNEDGCVQYELQELRDKPGTFCFYEIWRSQADLETHLEKPYLRDLKARADDLFDGPIDLSLWSRVDAS